MSISKPQFATYIKNFELAQLFIDLGWNSDKYSQPITVNNNTYTLRSLAEKSGFKIMLCPPPDSIIFPDKAERQKINNQFTKLKSKHIIIFIDENKTKQVWQIALKLPGKPKRFYEITYTITQDPEILYQKTSGLLFELKDEDNITIIDVLQKINENFAKNAETVTKKFYDGFKKQHDKFFKFVKGIGDVKNKYWYVSLMLNRLMFCYFIQKQRFLNKDVNYLRNKLNESQLKRGTNEFYSFYKDFLLVLFHDALNSPLQSEYIKKEFGKIPYLNGGLFDVHQLEVENNEITIDDKAFESIFDFFDEWNWHLDTRITATGKDINPDVIGYIFEKYINDRAAMGAYYTKEDITGYISKNSIIPYIFDEVSRILKCNLFEEGSEIYSMIKNSGDLYIYNSVKKGLYNLNDDINELEDIQDFSEFPIRKLPAEIEKGIKAVSERTEWNKTASELFSLPTEIWREVVERRNRYFDILSKIKSGKVRSINDFITFNLNIVQFTQDVIDRTDDPKLIETIYKVLTKVTILDPTCGSGAFLFAAMNILEPMYESCINRMQEFVSASPKGKFINFNKWLGIIKAPEHPNLKYFIYKTIILNNLYGVDIMNEAVEIAKLRLFLKIVATVEPDYKKSNLGLEPLPDIDFNIRCGNTLVGFVSEKELEDSFPLDFNNEKGKILEEMKLISDMYKRFKESQLESPGLESTSDFKEAKHSINKKLKEVNKKLSDLLSKAYGIDPIKEKKYESWLDSHQPFHWLAEFYEIVNENNGFDIIIGNPPYIELSKIDYSLLNFLTNQCGNLYALIIERCFKFINNFGKNGMIIPHSSICTDRMKSLMSLFKENGNWFSSYDIRPAKLFDGVDQRLLIYLTDFSTKTFNTSKYHRWYSEFRPFLFSNIEYVSDIQYSVPNSIIKAYKEIEKSILQKMEYNDILISQYEKSENIFYHNSPRYFIRVMSKPPYFWSENTGQKLSTQIKTLSFGKAKTTFSIGAILNSSLFYWWFILFSDSRHLNSREIDFFPFSKNKLSEINRVSFFKLFETLNNDFEKNKYRKSAFYKATGNIEYDEYYPRKSKQIIDEIDKVLARHYGFTDEEVDFIINYDVKYRMGIDDVEINED